MKNQKISFNKRIVEFVLHILSSLLNNFEKIDSSMCAIK